MERLEITTKTFLTNITFRPQKSEKCCIWLFVFFLLANSGTTNNHMKGRMLYHFSKTFSVLNRSILKNLQKLAISRKCVSKFVRFILIRSEEKEQRKRSSSPTDLLKNSKLSS